MVYGFNWFVSRKRKNQLKVFIGNIPCNIASAANEQIRCVTGPRNESINTNVVVILKTKGSSIEVITEQVFFFNMN